ncbi:MAG: AMP-binding protein [Parvularculaceae bacterium]|nr:AMP-binding protein [Parvularculaceae bacterium]
MVRAENSVQFLEAVFEHYRQGQVFAIQRPDTGLEDLVETLPAADSSGGTRGWIKLSYEPKRTNEPAQIVFTSGTEGKPKPIVISHGNLADVTERLNAMMQPTEDIREYIGVPVTYSFGIGRARAVAAAGGQCYLPEQFNPAEIRDMLEAGSINAISAVPSLWRVVLQSREILQGVADRVRWIEIGSQAMSADEKAAMRELFPRAKIVMHYGLTEASRTTLLDISAGEALASVGKAVGDVEVRLGAQDAIEIKGPHVALGQLGEGGLITPIVDADGWFTTKDRGRIEGYDVYFEGRLDDQINVGGIKTYAEAVEQRVQALVPTALGKFAVGAKADEMRGMTVVVGVERSAEDISSLIKAATEAALDSVGISSNGVVDLVVVDALPVTETGKVQRGKLAAFVGEKPTASRAAIELSGTMARVAEAWGKVQRDAVMTPEDSLYSLGADSLTSVQVAMTMETMGFSKDAVQATLQGRTIEEISLIADGGDEAKAASELALPKVTVEQWSVSAVRGFMISMVLVSHWGPGLFARLGLTSLEEYVLSVFYRMGTEGFATAFGFGLAYMIVDFDERKQVYLQRIRRNSALILGGLTALAAVKFAAATFNADIAPKSNITVYLYNVLLFFGLAMASSPVWMPLIARMKNNVMGILLIVACFYTLGVVAEALFQGPPMASPLELPRLMMVGGYNVFKMSAITLSGIAIGLMLINMSSHQRAVEVFVLGGLTGILLCAGTMFQIRGIDAFSMARELQLIDTGLGVTMYISFATFCLGALVWLFGHLNKVPGLLVIPIQVLVVFGGLTFVIYISQGFVIPAMDLLVGLGVGGTLALAAPMGVFLAVVGFTSFKLYRSYF